MPVAVSGANFGIAETGTICVVESEGNGRMCTTLPETLITVMGIEKVLPEWRDLEVFLQLLPRSSTAERMNPYTSLWTGVRETDGPKEFHLVLLDNGRTRVLADEVGRQALHCIRCSACLNVCPVYERAGGQAYESVYPGPIGAILTPQLRGLDQAPTLPWASSLCGACYEACPVKIDIPSVLVHLRARVVREEKSRLRARVAGDAGRRQDVRHARRLRARAAAVQARPRPARARCRCRAGARCASCPRCPSRRSGSGGVSDARAEVLQRIRGALGAGRRRARGPARLPRRRRARAVRRRRGRAVLRALRRLPGDGPAGERGRSCRRRSPRRAPSAACGGWSPRRAGRPDLEGLELVADDPPLGPRELDGFDGVLTGCALAIAETGTIVLDGGARSGRRAITLVPDYHACVVEAERIVAAIPDAVAAARRGGRRRPPDHVRLRPLRHVATSSWTAWRASTGRARSTSSS